ncbi:YbfB/YjiJ family MFS transporter [Vibrio tetraodonis]|uniref:YbfB/YjiJ family MFS transporter n=1 Tax=Vibrio tetraodonis TaxID=2231647 RepID=UPI000E0BBAAB|nr:YbfB/YjiJ family MFS transporter [Vibrio tetraodonis]
MTAETSQPNSLDIAKVTFGGICSLILTVGLARFSYTPMLPIMLKHSGLTTIQGGWLATLNYAGYMVGTLLISSMHNLRNKYNLHQLFLFLAVLSTTLMGVTSNEYGWGVLRFVSGISSVGGLLLASALILNWFKVNNLDHGLGVHFSGLGIGIVISGALVILASNTSDWSGQWIEIGLFGLLFLLPSWLFIPKPTISESKSHIEYPIRKSSLSNNKWMTLMMMSYACAGLGFVIGSTFIVSFLESSPLLSGRGGLVWILVGLSAIPSSFLWDSLSNKIGNITSLFFAYLVQLVSIILPVISNSLVTNILSAILFGLTFVGIVSITLTTVGRRFPEKPAKAMAKITLGYGISQILGPVITGYLSNSTGSYKASFLLTSIIMGIGLILLLKIRVIKD